MESIFSLNQSEFIAIVLSLRVAILCSVISLPVAVLLAYFLARYSFWGKSIVESVLHLPLVMPPVTTGYLLLLLLGTQGYIGSYLGTVFGIRLPFTFAAAVVSSIVVSFPLMIRAIRISMEMGEKGMEEASWTLGRGPVKTFFLITIPMTLPGIISGFILAFARSLGEFGATITFAGNIEGQTRTLPLAIYAYMQVPGMERATLRLVLVSVLISFCAMIVSEWLIKRMKKS